MKDNERARVAQLNFVFKMNSVQRKTVARTDKVRAKNKVSLNPETTSPLSVPPSHSTVSLPFALLLLIIIATLRCLLEPHERRLEINLET